MSIPRDPIAVSDVRLILPVTDPVASAAAYRILVGGRAGATRATAGNGVVEFGTADDPHVDFAVADLPEARVQLRRRGLDVVDRDERSADIGCAPIGITSVTSDDAAARRIDHVLLTHPDADAAIALYAGRLGMSLRRARALDDDVTQLFFRTATVIVEVVAGPAMAERDRFAGIAWLSADIDADRRNLVDAGLDAGDVRAGRKPGTRVCTVRDRAFGTPTLLIEQGAAPSGARR
ncbi:VOC family protein [Gordonia humi]|uniref:Catechol 2,3-dioxygenase-like lactoylglutathione lyase family enzyme n=1 Tax=Gordonia humi TaxID=686429 RepID=A0A840EXV4_9ACTN|nr:VOC family protein [Gordonia humi]MBB4136411.1 catechol 2,3-dioxygenase-like lactoylglutathione lyase family enzyme [Gordonia humi]